MAMRNPIVEIEDEDFLSQVAAAEAQALSSKRRKITTTTTTIPTSAAFSEAEGIYTSALRGSKSLLFQQQTTGPTGSNTRIRALAAANNSNAFAAPEFGGGGGGGGSCFKCGKLGHWARDCGDSGSSLQRGSVGDPSVEEKACPCGLGTCLVLTANTERNRGRKFYKCPVREENGGCGFFEWCDKNEGINNPGFSSQSHALNPSVNNPGFRSQSHALNPSVPDLPCPCGAGSCLMLTAKTGKNIGQAFYKCPANQGSSCGFFKWCHDQTTTNSSPVSLNTSKVRTTTEMSNSNYGTRGGSSCFKCGQDGHWAKDCAQPPIHNPAGNSSPVSLNTSKVRTTTEMSNSNYGIRGGSSCFKCGQDGHWAKDCAQPPIPKFAGNSSPVSLNTSKVRTTTEMSNSNYGTRGGSSCFKCGQDGHWAKDCAQPPIHNPAGRASSYYA